MLFIYSVLNTDFIPGCHVNAIKDDITTQTVSIVDCITINYSIYTQLDYFLNS